MSFAIPHLVASFQEARVTSAPRRLTRRQTERYVRMIVSLLAAVAALLLFATTAHAHGAAPAETGAFNR